MLPQFPLLHDAAALQLIIDALPSPMFVKDSQHRWVIMNEACAAFIGLPRNELLGKSDFDVFPEKEARHFWEIDDQVLSSGEDSSIEEQLTDAHGLTHWLLTKKRRIEIGGEPMIVCVVTDITSLREAEAHSRYLSLHDSLTGLPNRAFFVDRLDQALTRLRQEPSDHALLWMDLDGFKEVNDTLGHQAGDELLREFGSRVSALLRPGDMLARLGGDEFAILLGGLPKDFDLDRFCERILGVTRAPFLVGGQPLVADVSIGVVRFDDAQLDRGELLRRADVALYQSKHEGRGRHSAFRNELDERRRQRALLEAELRLALAGNGTGLELRYQPFVEGLEGGVVGVEALVRWNHPRLGLLRPAQFLAMAEESGLIAGLDDWVMRTACTALKRWPGLRLALNLSRIRMRDPRFPAHFEALLATLDFPARRLELEVTEAVLLNADDCMVDNLRAIRALGVRIALDNCGTGYSTLERIRSLAIDKIKIDRSFTQQIERSAGSSAIVRAILHIGQAMQLEVTAEGVETLAQGQFLIDVGCSELQGHFFSPSLSEEELARALRDRSAIGAQ